MMLWMLNESDATLLIDKMYILALVALTASIPNTGWILGVLQNTAEKLAKISAMATFENNLKTIPGTTLVGPFTEQKRTNMNLKTRSEALLSLLCRGRGCKNYGW
jgi:hypothetical protein